MEGIMTEPDAAATDTELADYYDQHRDLLEWDESESEIVSRPERLDITISVRFASAEIATVRAHAEAAGIKPTTYIRRCALAESQPPIDRTQLSRTVAALARGVDDLRRATG